MAHLIDKDALVAEMKKLVDKGKYHDDYECAFRDGNNSAIYAISHFLNTLEVKEVDLDWQDIYSILYLERIVQHEFGDHEYSNEDLCQEVLKRFKEKKEEKV